MPNKHKSPMLGWHPPGLYSERVRAEAARRDVPYSVILNEALAVYFNDLDDARADLSGDVPASDKENNR